MRRIRIVGVCAVAMLAIGAVVAGNASALPQWGQCYAVPGTGHWANSNCTTTFPLHHGPYEWRTAIAKKSFVDEGGEATLEGEYITCIPSEGVRAPSCLPGEATHAEIVKVVCGAHDALGEIKETKQVKSVHVVFLGCSLPAASATCSNAAAGEIDVNPLKGELGYIRKAAKEVGLLLRPELTSSRKRFVTFDCGGLSIVVGKGIPKEGWAYPLTEGGGDGIIAPITPVNQMTTLFTKVYTFNGAFENIPDKFESKPLTVLESYEFSTAPPRFTTKWSKAGLSTTDTMRAEEEIEIRA